MLTRKEAIKKFRNEYYLNILYVYVMLLNIEF